MQGTARTRTRHPSAEELAEAEAEAKETGDEEVHPTVLDRGIPTNRKRQ